MDNRSFPYRLYLVISEASCLHRPFLQLAEEAILGGVDIIQLREKNSSTSEFLKKAELLKNITDKYQVPLIINDNLEVARLTGAFGIHVGNNDLSPIHIREQWPDCKSLGYSIEYLRQLQNEATAAADCLGISPIFSTPTKKDTVTEWGIEGLRNIRQQTDKPLIAIGNMQTHNITSVIESGADCIAVVSAICSSAHPQKVAAELKSLITTALENKKTHNNENI